MANTLTRVRYAGLDFDTHEDELLSRLQVKFASVYNDFAVASLGMMIIDLFSFGLDTLSFYLDRRATDNFISTARTRKSVSRLARGIGYKMGAATAASVDVDIVPSQTYDFDITIPVGFQLQGPGSLIFELRQSVFFAAGSITPETVTASEVETLVASFTSDGTANQTFDISSVPDGKFILGQGTEGVSQVVVEVDGEEWEEVELLQFGETNQFEIGYNDSPPTLRFGDGIAGNIPADGAPIRVTFFATSGIAGQATAGTITEPVTSLVVGFEAIDLVINNPQGTSAGSDPETIASAKANAPNVFSARNVNVTLSDYQSRAQSFSDPVFGSVAVANAISVRGASSDVILSSLLESIRSSAADVSPTVSTATTSINASSAAITASVSAAQTADDALASDLSDVTTGVSSIDSSSEDATTAVGVIQSSASGLSVSASSLQSVIDGITVTGSDQLEEATRTSITNYIAAIEGRNNEIISRSGTASSELATIVNEVDSLQALGTSAETNRSTARSSVDSISTSNASILSTSTALASSVDDISTEVSGYADDVNDHVDSFLSNECKANLIEIPILSFDSEGFYVVPSIGLQDALERYLENGKEITQVIKVAGAEDVLVAADVTAHVGILSGYNERIVRSQVEAQILTVLRGRRFGVSLRLSELYAPISPESDDIAIEGVDFVNIRITGPSSRVDVEGNLSIQDHEVVTRGTITVTSEIVSVRTVLSS